MKPGNPPPAKASGASDVRSRRDAERRRHEGKVPIPPESIWKIRGDDNVC